MFRPIKLAFLNRHKATALLAQQISELPDILNQLGVPQFRPTLVLVGGASRMSASDLQNLNHLFKEAIVPTIQALNAVVVDGGTDAGVMKMMGQAYAELEATFPLVGVAVANLTLLPGTKPFNPEATPLDSNHTHFILVPGSNWGDDSPWIADVATFVAADCPSLTILINGGEITFDDAAHSLLHERPILVVAGSGRTADQFAAALRGEDADHRAEEMVKSGQIRALSLTDDFAKFAKEIKTALVG